MSKWVEKERTIELRNTFHNTTTTVRLHVNSDGTRWLSKGQAKKTRKKLCGIKGCTCGDVIGQRGSNIIAQERPDGSVILEY
jgi:hypothetical protein